MSQSQPDFHEAAVVGSGGSGVPSATAAAGRGTGVINRALGKRILVVEDDPSIVLGLRMNLEAEGYTVEVAEDGEAGLAQGRRGDADLIILDIMLPRLNGFEVLRQLRAEGVNVPTIVLSARHAELDIVMGLEFGAEDYVTKPFGIAELLARIKAVLRRPRLERSVREDDRHEAATIATSPLQAAALQTAALQTAALQTTALQTTALQTTALQTAALQTTALQTTALQTAALQTAALQTAALQTAALQTTAPRTSPLQRQLLEATPAAAREIRVGELEIDARTRQVTRGGEPVTLTATEFDILWCLVQADGRVLGREEIQTHVWGAGHHGTLRTIDNFMMQLRTKLERDPGDPQHLLTVRGVGYRLKA